MFNTKEERSAFMEQNGIVLKEDGFMYDGDGIINPYCISYLDDNNIGRQPEWRPFAGVYFTIHEALDRLSKIINSGQGLTVLIERANDLESYAKVYIPCTGIVSYSEYLQSSQLPATNI